MKKWMSKIMISYKSSQDPFESTSWASAANEIEKWKCIFMYVKTDKSGNKRMVTLFATFVHRIGEQHRSRAVHHLTRRTTGWCGQLRMKYLRVSLYTHKQTPTITGNAQTWNFLKFFIFFQVGLDVYLKVSTTEENLPVCLQNSPDMAVVLHP